MQYVMDIENAKQELGYQPRYDYIGYLRDYKLEMELKRFDEAFQRLTMHIGFIIPCYGEKPSSLWSPN